MSFEGYLKLLKPVFKMSNWKDAPTTVASHWITKAVMHWRDPQLGSWYTNHVVSPTSEFSTVIESLAKKSQLIALIMQELHSARSLKKVVPPQLVALLGELIHNQTGTALEAARRQSESERDRLRTALDARAAPAAAAPPPPSPDASPSS